MTTTHEEQMLELHKNYAGMLVRNLPSERVVDFAFAIMPLTDLSAITGQTNNYLSAIKTGRRKPTQQITQAIYAWYQEISQFPVSVEDAPDTTPIYESDDVRDAEDAMREWFTKVDSLTAQFRRDLRRKLRAVRNESPMSVHSIEESDIEEVDEDGQMVLPRRNGYTIETTPTGTQKYVPTHPEEWYDEETGELLTMNQRMARQRAKRQAELSDEDK